MRQPSTAWDHLSPRADHPRHIDIRPERILAALFDVLFLWGERRRQRRALGELDDRLLSDIGVSRADAACEFAKPFWRG
jgi:uncharacterized protein YjiS (DUF1127 family)